MSDHTWKVVVGGLVAMGGAGVAYMGQWALSGDLGQYGPIAAAMSAVVLNAVRVWWKSFDGGTVPAPISEATDE